MADITIVVEESVAVAVDAETNTALIVEVPEQGPAGPTGPTGPSGADGATWYTDAGAPSGALGEVGDMYLNYSNGDIYEKTGASTWTARMNVATGYTRLHDMTSTDDHSAGNYKIFYSDGSGHVQELVHGTANKVLTSNGATSAPSWEDAGTTSPLTTKGDVYTYDTDNARLPVGSNGQVLTADSGETTGLKWAAAGTSSPLTTKGDLYTYSTDNARLPVGTDGYVLKADSGETTGLIWAAESGGTGDKIEEGNSSVEVVDTGTGYISHTVEGTECLRVYDGGVSVNGTVTNHSYSGLNNIGDGNRAYNTNEAYSNIASYGVAFINMRARGTNASPSAVQDGDRIFEYGMKGWDGSSFGEGGNIICEVNGTPVSGKVPMRYKFYNRADGASGQTVRMIVDNSATTGIMPGVDDTYDCGSSSYRWDNIYATNSTIQTSDERMKTTISGTELGLAFICDLNPVSYKWKNYELDVEYYNEGTTTTETVQKTFTRKHYGMIAQDVITTLSGLGVDTADFAGVIYDEEADRYGLRYNEFIAPMIKAIQELKQENDTLKAQMADVVARLEALEG